MGGQSIPKYEYDIAAGVSKTFAKEFIRLAKFIGIMDDVSEKRVSSYFEESLKAGTSTIDADMKKRLSYVLAKDDPDGFARVWDETLKLTERATYQGAEAFIHNLNTMASRAGSQVPFSSINYGTGTSPEQRMVIKQTLLALEAGLGNGETPIFPIHVFKTKVGVNFEEGDPNYDLFKLACRVSSKRMFPTYTFLDAPFNLSFYKKGDPDTEVATMGCRTRVMANINGSETTSGRGNLSFTTMNLPRMAIESKGDSLSFMSRVRSTTELIVQQLLERYEVQAKRHVYNYPFLMGQGVWMGADKLSPVEEVRGAIKHGTLTIGFIGLAEAMVALFGKHHGQNKDVQAFALSVVTKIRSIADEATKKYHLNFSVIATPAEGLSGRFVRIDKKKYGKIQGVTDREYYTNSFHVPVYHPISLWDKIEIEAPYHELCNGGHITYIELDGDVSKNVEAFEQVIKFMGKKGIGYGAVNVPIDYDPVCGFSGVIGDVCPRCGRHDGEAISEEKLSEIKKKYKR